MKDAENIHGWLQLLRKWLSGDATHTDEAEMETRARTDEFLAEAIEGYRAFPDDDHQWHLDNIRERLARKKNKRLGILIYLPRVAAAVLVLAAAWWLLMPLLSPDGAELAQAEQKNTQQPRKEADLKAQGTEEVFPSENEELPPNEEAFTEPVAPPSEHADIEKPPSPAEPMAIETDTPARRTPGATLLPPPAVTINDQADTASPALNADEMAAQDAPAQLEVKGKVLDAESGQPLIAATVQVLGTDAGAITDVNGNFSLSVPEENARLLISYTGYQNAEVTASPGMPVTVQLQPATEALSEVVVTSRKKTTTKEIASAAHVIPGDNPAPKGGWKKWERYLRRKLNYPEEARAQGVKGEVTLRFVINEAGKPTRISVVKSLGSGCDEEAIRLLQNGPKWQPPGPATVTIKFE